MWLWRCIGPVRYIPGGKYTVPPPLAEAASMALPIASVHFACPSGNAPKLRTLKKPSVGGVCAFTIGTNARPRVASNMAMILDGLGRVVSFIIDVSCQPSLESNYHNLVGRQTVSLLILH